MNATQAVSLAQKCGWKVARYYQRPKWSFSFHKPDKGAVIWVRFSVSDVITKVEAHDFVNDVHLSPRRDKGARLSRYLTEGIAG